MAEIDFDEFGSGGGHVASYEALGTGVQKLANWAGAVVSVALIIGIAVWGYKLAVRDVAGVPVVRALEGPMRIAPTDPGGEITAHQGLAVNAVAAEGEAAPPPDRLVLAPAPVVLTDEDMTGAARQALAALPLPEPNLSPADPEPLEQALVEAVPVDEPVIDTADDLVTVADTDAAVAAVLAEIAAEPAVAVVSGGLGRSPRPAIRPAAIVRQADPAAPALTQVAAAATAATEVDAATLAIGTRLVQLGAFDDAATARAEWEKLSQRFPELLAGKSRVVQEAQSGGRAFFRLRAQGFADEADARRFCSALLSENAACIPVVIR